MRRHRRLLVVLLGLVALSVGLAACGGDDSGGAAEAPATEPAPAEAPATPPAEPPAPAVPEPPAPAPAEPEAPEPPTGPEPAPAAGAAPAEFSFTIAEGWSAAFVDEGIKPDLALDAAGAPGITYIDEDFDGWIRFASAAEDWQPQTVAEGYFYGPIGLSYDLDGQPHVVWHDHQDANVDLNLGDLTHAARDGSTWTIESAADPGHDGWDSTITIAEDGVIRAAGIEPSQFGFDNGVEYYERRDGAWVVEPVGSGPIAYEFNVSLAVSPDRLPALSYFNDGAGDLELATFDGSAWNIEKVATEGTTGMFSSLVFDAEGREHISFFETTDGTGLIHYAVRDGEGWTIEEVAPLDDVTLGQTGARRNSAIALGPDGAPRIVLSDRSTLSYAVRTDSGWEVEPIVTAGEAPLGQLVSFQLAQDGTPHLTFFEETSAGPLKGLVAYVTSS